MEQGLTPAQSELLARLQNELACSEALLKDAFVHAVKATGACIVDGALMGPDTVQEAHEAVEEARRHHRMAALLTAKAIRLHGFSDV